MPTSYSYHTSPIFKSLYTALYNFDLEHLNFAVYFLLVVFGRTCDTGDEFLFERGFPDALLEVVERVVQVGDGLGVELVQDAHMINQCR